MSNLSIFLTIGAGVGGALAGIKQVKSGIDTLKTDSLTAGQKAVALGKMSAASFGTAVSIASAIGGAVMAAAKPAIEFESAVVGVAKQLDGARDAQGNFTKKFYETRQEILKMGRELPVAHGEIAKVYENTLKMGVKEEFAKGFTEVAIVAGEAFQLPVDNLSETMGKVSTMYKRSLTDMRGLMDAVNYLDDNANSAGGDILNFMQRVGGTAAMVKMSDKNVAAYGSTLLSLGESSETASTMMNAVFSKFGAATTQPKKFRQMLSSLGLTPEEVANGMQTDANAMIQTINNRIKKLPTISDGKGPTQIDAVSTLLGAEHWDSYSKILQNPDELNRQISLANSKDAEGSMQKEFDARMKTTEAQMQTFKNRFGEVAITLGSALLPAINDLMASIGPVVTAFADWTQAHPELISNIVKIGAIAVGAIGGFMLLSSIVTGAMSLLAVFSTGVMGAARVVGIGFKLMTGQYGLLSAAMRLGLPVRKFVAFGNFIKGFGKDLFKGLSFKGLFKDFSFKGIFTALNPIKAIPALFGLIKGAVIGAAGAVKAFSLALLTNPMTWFVAGIVGGAFIIYKFWKPISGLFKGIWDVIGQSFAPLSSAFSAIGDALSPIFDWLGRFFNLTQVGEGSARSLGQTVGNMLVGAFKTLGPVILAVFSPLTALVGLAVWAWHSIGELWSGTISIGDIFAGAKAKFDEFKVAAMAKASEIWQSIKTKFSESFPNLSEGIGKIADSIGKVLDSISQTWDGWMTKLEGYKTRAKALWDSFTGIFKGGSGEGAGGGVGGGASGGGFWSSITSGLETARSTIAEKASGMWEGAKAKFDEARTSLTTKASEIWSSVTDVLQGGQGVDIGAMISQTVNGAITAISSAASSIGGVLSTMVSGMSTALLAIFPVISSAFTGVINVASVSMIGLSAVLTAGFSGMAGIVAAGWLSLGGAMAGNPMLARLQAAMGQCIAYLGSVQGRFFSLGANITAGLARGMESNLGRIRAAVRQIVSETTKGTAAGFQIRSPSRVMMGMGRDVVAGLDIGMRKRFGSTLTGYKDNLAKLSDPIPVGDTTGGELDTTGIGELITLDDIPQGYDSGSGTGGMGAGGMTITYSPVINTGGNAPVEQMKAGLAMSLKEFERMLKRVQDAQQRRAYV